MKRFKSSLSINNNNLIITNLYNNKNYLHNFVFSATFAPPPSNLHPNPSHSVKLNRDYIERLRRYTSTKVTKVFEDKPGNIFHFLQGAVTVIRAIPITGSVPLIHQTLLHIQIILAGIELLRTAGVLAKNSLAVKKIEELKEILSTEFTRELTVLPGLGKNQWGQIQTITKTESLNELLGVFAKNDENINYDFKYFSVYKQGQDWHFSQISEQDTNKLNEVGKKLEEFEKWFRNELNKWSAIVGTGFVVGSGIIYTLLEEAKKNESRKAQQEQQKDPRLKYPDPSQRNNGDLAGWMKEQEERRRRRGY